MKNPLDIAELYAAGFSWRASVTAANHLTPAFWRRLFLSLFVAGWCVWAVAAYMAVANAEERTAEMEAWKDTERKRGDFYESQLVNCLNWKTAQISGVVFDCPMKEAKR